MNNAAKLLELALKKENLKNYELKEKGDAMNRPYIICHMVTSIDGKATGRFLKTEAGIKAAEHYFQIHRDFGADAFACGKLTMESSFTGGWYPDLSKYEGQKVEREDYIADYEAEFYAVAFDTHGKLGWKDAVIHDDDPGYDNAHIVEVLSEAVTDAYLVYLKEMGISYIFAGKNEIDIEQAVYKLWHHCIARKLLLEGGSTINGAFTRAGVIDELSFVQAPVVADKDDKTIFHDANGGEYQLIKAEQLENAVWLRYHSSSISAIPRLKLKVVIDAIESVTDEWQYFYALKRHECIWISEFGGFDDEEERELLDEEPERFIRMPDKYEIHEYSIMEDFIESLPEGNNQNQLYRAIRGKGAFRRFKDSVNRMEIAEIWYEFQANAYKEIAVRWCQDNGYEYDE